MKMPSWQTTVLLTIPVAWTVLSTVFVLLYPVAEIKMSFSLLVPWMIVATAVIMSGVLITRHKSRPELGFYSALFVLSSVALLIINRLMIADLQDFFLVGSPQNSYLFNSFYVLKIVDLVIFAGLIGVGTKSFATALTGK